MAGTAPPTQTPLPGAGGGSRTSPAAPVGRLMRRSLAASARARGSKLCLLRPPKSEQSSARKNTYSIDRLACGCHPRSPLCATRLDHRDIPSLLSLARNISGRWIRCAPHIARADGGQALRFDAAQRCTATGPELADQLMARPSALFFTLRPNRRKRIEVRMMIWGGPHTHRHTLLDLPPAVTRASGRLFAGTALPRAIFARSPGFAGPLA